MTGIFDTSGRSNWLDRRAASLAVIAVAFTVTFTSRAEGAEITVTWVDIQQQVSPRQTVNSVSKSVRLNLQGGNAISDSFQARNMRGRTRNIAREGRLREGMERGRSSVAWRVGDSKTLIRTASYPQNTETIRVRTISETACQATVAVHLNPGFRQYMLFSINTGEPLYFSSLAAQEVTCTVRN